MSNNQSSNGFLRMLERAKDKAEKEINEIKDDAKDLANDVWGGDDDSKEAKKNRNNTKKRKE